jgi:hypothetical protein
VAALLGWVVGEQSSAALPALCSTENRRQFFESARDADVVFAAEMQSYRRQRTGYPVVMRYPDVPPPIDLYPVLDNAKAAGTMAYLFPAKGWLPTDKFAKLTDRVLFAQ